MTPVISNKPVKIFLSYSHKDEELLNELVIHLTVLLRQGLISSWHEREITDATRVTQVDQNLELAQIILLLVSPSYIASDYCYDIEMTRAMERHANGEARVIPLILRPVDWMTTPFSKLQALPKNAQPVTSWLNRDEAFIEIVKEIRRTIEAYYIDSALSSESNEVLGFVKPKFFISYSRKDVDMLYELTSHLRVIQSRMEIEFWADNMILAGDEWAKEIERNLNRANIILILLSSAYFSSDWLKIEFEKLLRRRNSAQVRIIPIILSPTNISPESPLSQMQFLPRDGKPVSTWTDRNEAWLDVMRGLQNVILNFRQETIVYSDTSSLKSTGILKKPIYQIGNIFRTAGPPELNYEEPQEFNSFKVELQTLGKGLAVEGPSGIGKTSTMRKAIDILQPASPPTWISSLSDDCYQKIDNSLKSEFEGYLIIDDFHHLSDEYKNRIAKAIKNQSEQVNPKSKIIVIGINRVGHMLMEGFPELTGRVGIISMNKQADEKVQAMIEKGEEAANITFLNRATIVEVSDGSFFTAQYFCLYLAEKAGVTCTQNEHKRIEYGPTDVLSKVLKQFESKYRRELHILASMDASRPLKGVGLALLWLLRCEGVGSEGGGFIFINEAKQQYPKLKQNFDILINGELQTCFDDNKSLSKLIFYDKKSQMLVIEDPQLVFYLRNMIWNDFALKAGHEIEISTDEKLIFKEHKLSNQLFSILYTMKEFWNSLPNPVKIFVGFGLVGLSLFGVVQSDKLPFLEGNNKGTENIQKEMIEVQLLIQTEDSQPISDVAIQVISQGAPTTIFTNSSGYARIKIPSRDDVDLVLKKEGYKVLKETVNLSTDPNRNKSFRLKKLN